jgi:hypothetical protein
LTAISPLSSLKGKNLQEYLMMKNARWDNEVVLDYIEQHDSDAFKKHDEKVRKEALLEKAKEQAKKMLAKKRPLEEIIDITGLTKEEIEAL